MEKAKTTPLPYHRLFLLAPEVVTFVPPFRLAARSPQFVGSVAQVPQTDPVHLISVPPTSPPFFRLPCSCVCWRLPIVHFLPPVLQLTSETAPTVEWFATGWIETANARSALAPMRTLVDATSAKKKTPNLRISFLLCMVWAPVDVVCGGRPAAYRRMARTPSSDPYFG